VSAKKKKSKHEPEGVILCRNRKARFNYEIEETLEAGIALKGSEVKSIRTGRASLNEAFVIIEREEAFVVGAHVAEWPFSHALNHKPTRRRKLLLHKREILRLMGKVREKGLTLIPLFLYAKNGKIKVSVGLARGKRQYDKRQDIRKRDMERDAEMESKGR